MYIPSNIMNIIFVVIFTFFQILLDTVQKLGQLSFNLHLHQSQKQTYILLNGQLTKIPPSQRIEMKPKTYLV